MTTRTIEPRKPTNEPLVEIALNADGSDGAFVPTGRRNAGAPAGFGLTETEKVAFDQAIARLNGQPNDFGTDPALDAAMAAAGLTSTSDAASIRSFIDDYRAKNPLPTSLAPLAPGDPSSNIEEVPDDVPVTAPVPPAPSSPSAPPKDEVPAHLLGSSEPGYKPLEVPLLDTPPQQHVDRMHSILDRIENTLSASERFLATEARAILVHLGLHRSA
jgi:hypothetical protein